MVFSTRLGIGGNLSSKWASWNIASFHQSSSVGQFKNHVLHYHKRTSESLLSTTMSTDLNSKFMQVYDQLKSELIHDPLFEFDDVLVSGPTRKDDPRTIGVSVVDSYQLLKGEELEDGEVFLACALGWCIEWGNINVNTQSTLCPRKKFHYCNKKYSVHFPWKPQKTLFDIDASLPLQAYLLVLDDIIDESHIRRGHPCWFRRPEGVHQDYENKSHEEFIKSIEVLPNKAVQEVLKSFLTKLFKRQK